jgi:hypothetical protein
MLAIPIVEVVFSPEAVAAAIALAAAPLGYFGAGAGAKATVQAAREQARGAADQQALTARRTVYAEFAQDARALVDGVHQYVMAPGADVGADYTSYGHVLAGPAGPTMSSPSKGLNRSVAWPRALSTRL